MHLLSRIGLKKLLERLTMSYNFLKTRLASPPYSRIDQENLDEGLLEKSGIPYTSSFKQSRFYYLLISVMFTAVAGVAG